MVIENNDTLVLQEQIEKLNKKKKDMTELFSIEKLDYDTFKEVKSVIDSKLEVLNNELDKINKYSNEEDLINEEIIKEVIVNLKNNFIHLNNHEKKMFLERFVKEIKVRKENNEVMIESVVFWDS